jgi:phospholipase D1/2
VIGQGTEGAGGGSVQTKDSDVADGIAGSAKSTAPGAGGWSGGDGGEGESKQWKASGPNNAWAEWEKVEMEQLLGEVRGHLGESRRLRQLMWLTMQSSTRRDSSRRKTWPTISCSMLVMTGCHTRSN